MHETYGDWVLILSNLPSKGPNLFIFFSNSPVHLLTCTGLEPPMIHQLAPHRFKIKLPVFH